MSRADRRRREREQQKAGGLPPWTPFVEKEPKGAPLEKGATLWENSRYLVIRRVIQPTADPGGPPLVHLSIKRHDQGPVIDWRDKQRIKNELIGEEEEAVELFPAESRLLDSSNQYHLWAIVGMRMPFGYDQRFVTEHAVDGAAQRPFEDGAPADAVSREQIERQVREEKARRRSS